jgi:uncharacterized small protein (DUF1192 family)
MSVQKGKREELERRIAALQEEAKTLNTNKE